MGHAEPIVVIRIPRTENSVRSTNMDKEACGEPVAPLNKRQTKQRMCGNTDYHSPASCRITCRSTIATRRLEAPIAYVSCFSIALDARMLGSMSLPERRLGHLADSVPTNARMNCELFVQIRLPVRRLLMGVAGGRRL